MPAPWAGWLACCAVVLVAACQTAPPPPTSTTTTLDPDAARERLATALGEAGLRVERTPDGLRATTTSSAFVRCLPVTVSTDERQSFTQVSDRTGVVDVRFVGNDRTTATWQTTFTGRYLNRLTNTPFDRACDSSGQLEQLIVQTLGS